MGAILIAIVTLATAPLRIDLNPDTDRKDVETPRVENWRLTKSHEQSRSFAGLTITLLAVVEQAELTPVWWKAGYDTGATFTSDGVAAPGGIDIILTGLAPGRHSLTAWHNFPERAGRVRDWSLIAVSLETPVAKTPGALKIRPTVQVTHDHSAASSHIEFTTAVNQEIIIKYRSPGDVVLNGLMLDGIDPRRQITQPTPADHDEHVPTDVTLRWHPAALMVNNRVYFGVDPNALKLVSTFADCSYRPPPLTPDQEYYWRVDEQFGETIPEVVTGELQRFRVRRLAFPGAEGHGRFAIGGRGERVIEVTSLADAGPGTLRTAIDAEGPRTIVFRVGGTIQLRSKLVVRHPYVTIAGQTAPGDGICVRGYTFGCLGTHDVIMQHLRIRVGDEAGLTLDGTGFASTDHAIMDHCSISWSQDEAISTRGAGNITVQRCLIAEALNIAGHKKYEPGKGHSFAASISGNVGSFHHNLLAHCAGRNWSLAGGLNRGGQFAGRLDLRNNVVYNWEHRTTDGGAKAVNFVNNYYLPGPASRVFHLLKPDVGKDGDPQQYFVAGNVMVGHHDANDDPWKPTAVVVDPAMAPRIRMSAPFGEANVQTQSAADAFQSVVADVGANVPRLDAVDRRIIAEVIERKATHRGSRSQLPGVIDSQTDVGGWPELNSGAPPADSDHDGMPDDWEQSHQLDPHDPADRNLLAPTGYSWLEVYLQELASKPHP